VSTRACRRCASVVAGVAASTMGGGRDLAAVVAKANGSDSALSDGAHAPWPPE